MAIGGFRPIKVPIRQGRLSKVIRVDEPLGDFLKSKQRKGETMSDCVRRLLETPAEDSETVPDWEQGPRFKRKSTDGRS